MNYAEINNGFTIARDQAYARKLLYTIAIPILLLFIVPQDVYPQVRDVFQINKQVKDVKKRFGLSPRDVRAIEPLIDQENRNIVRTYAGFIGEAPEYSRRVWREIIICRLEFESTIDAGLTKRQASALRAARSGIEKRLLNYLVEDYVSYLGHYLYLTDWEMDEVQTMFDSESKRKYELVTRNLTNPAILQTEIGKICKETEERLRKLLDEEQWRIYLNLTAPNEFLV